MPTNFRFRRKARTKQTDDAPSSNVRSIRRRAMNFETLERRAMLDGTPVISEILASNGGGIVDEDGDSSDWVEIYNPTGATVDLEGWHLTDDRNDLNQWTFPTLSLQPEAFVTVFASGKNRAVAGGQLHTNFRLSGAGEYLALVTPGQEIASEFAPTFPQQVTDISYGLVFNAQSFIAANSDVQYLVPGDATLGDQWTEVDFPATGWASGKTGIGFGVLQPGFSVTYVTAAAPVNDLNAARDLLADPNLQLSRVDTNAPVINYLANGGGGNFGDDLPFPTQEIGQDFDDFVVQASATIVIPQGGLWSFGVNSDDGFALRLQRGNHVLTSEYFSPRPAFDTIAVLDVPEAGTWEASLIMYERGGGASVEFFAAPGKHPTFSPGNFALVGDTQRGGLEAFSTVVPGSGAVVETDVDSSMLGVNASILTRIPFTVADPDSIDTLTLKMRYNDGFVAYLNGVEVVRRNAPASLRFDSSATAARDLQQSLNPESISLTAHRALLLAGWNILAIQGLNASPSDSSFLLLPTLTGTSLQLDQQRYFAAPTPNDPNSAASLGIVSQVQASVPAGFYNDAIAVTLSSADAGSEIRYTLDGSAPSQSHGQVYSSPVSIDSTTVLRAAAFRTDYITLPGITRTYLYLEDVIHQSANGAPPPGWPSNWGNNTVDYGMDPDRLQAEGADRVKQALLALPTLTISTDLENLFDPARGIYANAYGSGRGWERPAAFELLNPDGSPGFQVNAGLRIRGGYSRSGNNPKHAFRLFFRGEYGNASLDYPLFGTEGVSSFKKIDLRTAQNYSWSFGGDPSNTMLEDNFARETQRDLGQPYTRSRWYHLYLNGQYWGLFQTQERAEAEFAASYFGGSAANYDVVKAESGPYIITATDGNLEAFRRLWKAAVAGFDSNADYFRIQGKNPDGTDNSQFEVLLDVDNLATYMIDILYGGNLDAPISNFLGNTAVNNFFAIRDRTGRQGFRYFQHDAEHTLRNLGENRNGPYPAGEQFERFNPQWLHQRLMANSEYRLRFADIVQRTFSTGGALEVASSQARWQAQMDVLALPIVGESLRWGDAKRPDSPLTDQDWLQAASNTRDGFLANRNSIVLQQFRDVGLLPALAAPDLLVDGQPSQGGRIDAGSILRFAAADGLVYYSNDGSDPRLIGGDLDSNALVFDPGSSTDTLVALDSRWSYYDQPTALPSNWHNDTFDDSFWPTGVGEFGYGDGDENTVLSFGADPNSKPISTYFRSQFSLTDPDQLVGVTLRLKRDDGAIIYINGAEAGRSNMSAGPVDSQTPAASVVGGSNESHYFEISIDPMLLRAGGNLIAVEVHQVSAQSSDVSFQAELLANRQTNPGIVLQGSNHIVARQRDVAGQWSAASEGQFIVAEPASANNLVITELMYNPPAATAGEPVTDKENFEFIELRNIGPNTIDLTGVRFTAGISYDFSTASVRSLAPGQHLVLARNLSAFQGRYGKDPLVGGTYELSTSNSLSNGGELMTLVDAHDQVIKSFTYDDDPTTTPPWPTTPDGQGFSLSIRRTTKNYNAPASWRASYRRLGTPGFEENDYPDGLTLSDDIVAENAADAIIGTLVAADPNSVDSHSYTIRPDSDGTSFTISGNKLLVGSVPLDYETGSTRTVTVRATDPGGLFIDKSFTIRVTNVNEAAHNVALSNDHLEENISGIVVGNLSASDPESNDTHTFTVDDDRFEVVGSELRLRADKSVTQNAGPSLVIFVTAVDSGTPQRAAEFQITLNVDANPFPWHNRKLPLDVDDDGNILPADAIRIINELNRPFTSRENLLPPTRPQSVIDRFYDVVADGLVVPFDALRVINHLNHSPDPEGESTILRRWEGANAWNTLSVSRGTIDVQSARSERQSVLTLGSGRESYLGLMSILFVTPTTQVLMFPGRSAIVENVQYGLEDLRQSTVIRDRLDDHIADWQDL
ncbi:MAG: hypothetical protein FJ295_02355 [Planctomycetes bacterium]|nr:hypothetical protein [Planctomycetota bacterium]